MTGQRDPDRSRRPEAGGIMEKWNSGITIPLQETPIFQNSTIPGFLLAMPPKSNTIKEFSAIVLRFWTRMKLTLLHK
jgi:hypothetical protein